VDQFPSGESDRERQAQRSFDIRSLVVPGYAAIHFVTGWANERMECEFGVTNR